MRAQARLPPHIKDLTRYELQYVPLQVRKDRCAWRLRLLRGGRVLALLARPFVPRDTSFTTPLAAAPAFLGRPTSTGHAPDNADISQNLSASIAVAPVPRGTERTYFG